MKTTTKIFATLLMALLALPAMAQTQRDLDNFRYRDQRGINQFEAPKDTVSTFEGLHVRVGGASTLQFQALTQEGEGPVPLQELGSNFNLATANLDLDVALYDGVRMHLRTYLSSQHHTEAYVKGGYIQIDKLDFIKEGFAEGLMDHLRIKIGHMENNYGDGHFRRTDNAQAIYNPFVGNYVMDAFTTEVGAEVYYFNGPWLGMVGFTNGKLNQNVTDKDQTSPSFLGKLGYDNQAEEGLRFRLTGSVFHSAHNAARGVYLYRGDRAGSRYYSVISEEGREGNSDGFRGGMVVPDFQNEMTSFMINPFLKYGGLEFFGIIETVTGKDSDESNTRTYNQFSGELLYRFGNDDDFHIGARYNTVNGDLETGEDIDVDRFQLAAGWYMTRNILMKVEYVNQNYNGYPSTDYHHEAKFDGLMLEAAISF
ncbi:hypothetical protein GCM10023115_37650 [Pontixanthobacter gangjinensis]|uniref:Porin n=1 Tax=Christiangramia aestuarii TaxID=1028746 RepID=A0A7K1LQM6_9FLAO|nr:hypothetical protein [Christiangramia aestuarii]MUP43068.1 hypothetical protein [Christiangramia aestuarii]